MAIPKFPIKKPDSPYSPVLGPPLLDKRIMELLNDNKFLAQFITSELSRYRLIVEIEVDAVDHRDAERGVLGIRFQTKTGDATVHRVLMCEPVVGGDVNETLP